MVINPIWYNDSIGREFSAYLMTEAMNSGIAEFKDIDKYTSINSTYLITEILDDASELYSTSELEEPLLFSNSQLKFLKNTLTKIQVNHQLNRQTILAVMLTQISKLLYTGKLGWRNEYYKELYRYDDIHYYVPKMYQCIGKDSIKRYTKDYNRYNLFSSVSMDFSKSSFDDYIMSIIYLEMTNLFLTPDSSSLSFVIENCFSLTEFMEGLSYIEKSDIDTITNPYFILLNSFPTLFDTTKVVKDLEYLELIYQNVWFCIKEIMKGANSVPTI